MDRKEGLSAPASVRTALEFAFVAAVAYLMLKPLWRSATFTIYQARDLLRAQEVVKGRLIFFGPEATGGGFLPGGFYYDLLAIPLKLGLGWMGAFRLMLAAHAAGAAAIWLFFRRRASLASALIATLFYLGSGNLALNVSHFMNSSFLPLLTVLITILLLKTFDPTGDRKSKLSRWLAACVLLGLAIQIHFTVFVFFLGIFCFQKFALRFGLIRLTTPQMLCGLGAFLILLLPYFIWLAAGHVGYHFGVQPLPVGGSDWSPASVQFFATESKWGLNHLGGLKILRRLLDLFCVPESLWLLAVSGFLVWSSRKRRDARPFADDASLRIILVILGFALMPGLFHINIGWALRYSIIFQISLAFLAGALTWQLERFGGRKLIWGAFLFLLLLGSIFYKSMESPIGLQEVVGATGTARLIFIPCAVFAAVFLSVTSTTKERVFAAGTSALFAVILALKIATVCMAAARQDQTMTIDLMRKAASIIKSQTGWNYRQARERLFFLNLTNYFSFEMMDEFNEDVPGAVHANSDVDGYFVGLKKQNEPDLDPATLKSWLHSNKLEATLLAAVDSGDLKLDITSQLGPLLIVSYKFVDPIRLGDHFQNIGLPYTDYSPGNQIWPPEAVFSGVINNCPGKRPVCNNEIHLWRAKAAGGEKILKVSIVGNALSQSSEFNTPAWNEGWRNPYIEISCNGEKYHLELADSLGLVHGDPTANREVYAPFERSVDDPCQGREFTSVEFGYASDAISSNMNYSIGNGRALPLK